MKLDELKTKVYKLTGVNTTQQPLDLRRKTSWEKALTIAQKSPEEFQNWLDNPPEEYKELFGELETASEAYSKQLIEVKPLGEGMIAIADDLEKLAGECQDTADLMKQEVRTARRIKKQAQLN